ncbi:MAG: 3-dehydroquinate synthase [Oscillospiraceae bacterium]|nr:3-dehydroquinate synthase [Oscillospiraceae bacterium]
MQTVMVNASSAYPVHIGAGLLEKAGGLIAETIKSWNCAIITDSTVEKLYAAPVCRSLQDAGFRVCLHAFPAGEQNKNLTSYGKMLEFLAENKLTRSDFAVALGGGVVGDMAGFAAATYQRGIDFIQIPTTFLAAADSSVGGKTAIDLAAGKNLAGAFHQPKMVICDTDTFKSLPPETFADGMAETLKHGLIADKDFFDELMLQNPGVDKMVRRDVEIKAAVVREDEFEHGTRKFLNFGHTLGHAIEKCSGYTTSHGHAVAVGMVLAARAAERLGYSPAGTLEQVIAANEKYHLPTQCPYTADELYAAATSDKKRDGGSIDVVVLERIGQARTVRLDMDGLRTFVEAAVLSGQPNRS